MQSPLDRWCHALQPCLLPCKPCILAMHALLLCFQCCKAYMHACHGFPAVQLMKVGGSAAVSLQLNFPILFSSSTRPLCLFQPVAFTPSYARRRPTAWRRHQMLPIFAKFADNRKIDHLDRLPIQFGVPSHISRWLLIFAKSAAHTLPSCSPCLHIVMTIP